MAEVSLLLPPGGGAAGADPPALEEAADLEWPELHLAADASAGRAPLRRAVFAALLATGLLAAAPSVLARVAAVGPRSTRAAPAKDSGDEILMQEVTALRTTLLTGVERVGCLEPDTAYEPIDMLLSIPRSASDAAECQEHCLADKDCAHFSYDTVSELCHLQDKSATKLQMQRLFVAGPPACPTTTATVTSTTVTHSSTATTTATTTVAAATTTLAATLTATAAATTTLTATLTATAKAAPAATTPPTPPAATLPAVPTPAGWISLFCFMVTGTTGFEPNLARAQLKNHAGIFACDQYSVFSSSVIMLAPGTPTTSIGGVKDVKGPWGSWLNTDTFILAWAKIVAEGRFRAYAWTAKSDPDTVWFPDRLRQHLQKASPAGPAYIKNCPKAFGMAGPLEAFSREAVEDYGRRHAECKKVYAQVSGEDGYMQACMEVLGVRPHEDFALLSDGWCTPGGPSCVNNHQNVAFHPFKETGRWLWCRDQVLASDRQDLVHIRK